MKYNALLAGSVSCFDLYNLERQMEQIAQAPVDLLHYDVVDGRFNNCIILGLPLLKALRPHTNLPIEAHLAVYEPEKYIAQFVQAGADIVSVHPEGTEDILGAFDLIRRCGATPALALRSETEPSPLILEAAAQAAYVIKLTVNPGYSGQQIQQESFARMLRLRQAMDAAGIDTPIAADGNVNCETIPTLVRHGAGMMIGGTSGLIRPGQTVKECAAALRETFQREKALLA